MDKIVNKIVALMDEVKPSDLRVFRAKVISLLMQADAKDVSKIYNEIDKKRGL